MSFILRSLVTIFTLSLAVLGLSTIDETFQKPIVYEKPIQIKTVDSSFEEEFKEETETIEKPLTVEATSTSKITEKKPTIETPIKTPETSVLVNIPSLPTVFKSEINTSDLNTKVRESVVNIFCASLRGGPFRAATGSGVIIDPRGVIITNAHVGQYYLLKNYTSGDSVECVIRGGSPAKPLYRGELLFISPKWIEDNKENLKKENPLGTGENDFALILITKKIDGSPIQQTFPFISTEEKDSAIDRTSQIENIVVGYPAGFLGGIAVEKDLYIASSISKIKDIFTFKETTIDLISLGGNVLAQKGASGGAVVSSLSGKLIGLIVTTTNGETTGERDLRAVTLPHIERSIKTSTGKSLEEYLKGNVSQTQILFSQTTYPQLAKILIGAIAE